MLEEEMKKIVGVGLILFSSIVLGACGNSNSNSDTPKETTTASSTMVSLEFSSSVEKKKTNLLSNDSDFGKIADNVPDGESIEVQGKQDYSTNFNDNSWAGVNLNIDRVSVVKTTDIKDYSDNQYNGFVAVHYNIDNTQQDVSIYPNQATIVTDYGEQVDDGGVFNYDSWDGDFMKGTKKMVGASILYQNFLMHLQSNLFD
ncbi:hypothetical protein NWO25_17370 [Enterococcus lactis]|nr:hypothetical protein [Enterococcus lactis]